jgi:2-polyprenyl-3-methyl-5-hydroxy-6-metoxy-1,4-benzoquinol methylase
VRAHRRDLGLAAQPQPRLLEHEMQAPAVQQGITPELEDQQAALADVQLDDFRAANLFRMIAQRLAPGSVLDVGCGAGGLVAWMLERGVDAHGIDLSPATVRVAQRFLQRRKVDSTRISADSAGRLFAAGRRFDNVVSMDCLEHIEDDRAAISDLVSLLVPGGRLLITVPAMMALYGARDEKLGHFRRYERDSLMALVSGLPVRVDELRWWNLLGVAPTLLSQRLLGRNVDEKFRYGKPSLPSRALRAALFAWFRAVENNVRPPRGLTLIMTATRL